MKSRFAFLLYNARLFLAAVLVGLPAFVHAAVGPVDPRVRLNSVGFTPGAVKEATVAAPAMTFRVRRVADDSVVLEGLLGTALQTSVYDTDEAVRVADFSTLRAAGEYQLEVPGIGRSAPFRVAADLWNEPLRLVARGFYLWRCGTGVTATWQGQTYRHAPCHLGDARTDFVGGGQVRRDGTGGWHDAGDYNKYVVNAGVSVGLLFKAWEHFRGRISQLELDLPETGNGVPDLLNELRWELDWLLKMQAPDGRVYHKLSARDFTYWGVPESDPSPRYFVPWGSTATADFTAMMAMAARNFAEFDAPYANRCLAAARAAWAVLVANPADVPADQTGFSTGGYGASDAPHRLWAAAEMWATTREAVFLRDFERRAATQTFDFIGPTWSDVTDLGLTTYLENESLARDPALVQRLRNSLLTQAAAILQTVSTHAYGRGLGGGTWFWGANGSVAAQTMILHVADRFAPDPAYRQAAEESLGFLFGRNYHNRSYVTGLGYQPPEHPHDRRGEPAWPGYLVGGGWPTGRSWQDVQGDYEENEIAINWNASLVYALAAFAQPENSMPTSEWAVFAVGQPGSYASQFDPPTPSSFTAGGLPFWASFDPTTGVISGSPADDPATPENDARRIHAVTLRAYRGVELVESRRINLMVAAPGSGLKIRSLSARALVRTDEKILIAGFVVSGSAPRTLLLRGIGPTLADFGVTGVLSDPTLTLFEGQNLLRQNDNWSANQDAADIRTLSNLLGAFPLADASRDAVLLSTLPAAAYTAQVAGVGGASGVGLAEVYDGTPNETAGQLVSIAARARVGGGDAVLIAGIVLSGGGSARILVRAVGPTLGDYGVADPLRDPVLTVYSGQTVLTQNDDWGSSQADEIAASAAAAHTFTLPAGSRDAAVIARLVDGAFTFKVEGKNGEPGVALVELYLLP